MLQTQVTTFNRNWKIGAKLPKKTIKTCGLTEMRSNINRGKKHLTFKLPVDRKRVNLELSANICICYKYTLGVVTNPETFLKGLCTVGRVWLTRPLAACVPEDLPPAGGRHGDGGCHTGGG